MTAPEYVASGKQVLRDGRHWADCIGPAEAAALADVLNGQMLLNVPEQRAQEIQEILWS